MLCLTRPPLFLRGGEQQKKTDRERRHKENKLDDNGLPKTIETAVGVNCRVAHVGQKRRKAEREKECETEGGKETPEGLVPLTKFTTCVCVCGDDENDENGDH